MIRAVGANTAVKLPAAASAVAWIRDVDDAAAAAYGERSATIEPEGVTDSLTPMAVFATLGTGGESLFSRADGRLTGRGGRSAARAT